MANNQSLQLSATELRTMTKWPDAVILEFLSLQAGVTEINEIINIVINDTTINGATTASNTALIYRTMKDVQALVESVSVLDSLAAKVSSNKRDGQRLIDNLSESIEAAVSRVSHLAAKVRSMGKTISDIQEQAVIPNFQFQARLNREIDARMDLQQELYGS